MLEEHRVELVAGRLDDASDGHDTAIGLCLHLMTSAFLHIHEGVLGAEGVLAIEYHFYFTFEHIECLLHIWMDMGSGYFAFLE